MGSTWVLSAPDGPNVGLNLAIWVYTLIPFQWVYHRKLLLTNCMSQSRCPSLGLRWFGGLVGFYLNYIYMVNNVRISTLWGRCFWWILMSCTCNWNRYLVNSKFNMYELGWQYCSTASKLLTKFGCNCLNYECFILVFFLSFGNSDYGLMPN